MRDTTLDNENYNVCNIRERCIDRMCVVVMALCNQPEAFAAVLGDDYSRYLFVIAAVQGYESC